MAEEGGEPTSTTVQGRCIEVIITQDWDLSISVYDLEPINQVDHVHDDVPSFDTATMIKRHRLFSINSSALLTKESKVLDELLLKEGHNAEVTQETQVDNVDAFEIVLRGLHDRRNEKLWRVQLRTVWQAFFIIYNFKIRYESLYEWFNKWYEVEKVRNPFETLGPSEKLSYASQLYFPAYYFDHADAFSFATHHVMYYAYGGPIFPNVPVAGFSNRGILDNSVTRTYTIQSLPYCSSLTHFRLHR